MRGGVGACSGLLEHKPIVDAKGHDLCEHESRVGGEKKNEKTTAMNKGEQQSERFSSGTRQRNPKKKNAFMAVRPRACGSRFD